MLDIGFLEMTTIGVVALVVIGPERLPAVAAKVGRYVGKAQKFVRGVRSDISRELESGDLKQLIGDQKNQIDELRQMVNTATKDIQSSTKETFKGVEDSVSELKSTVTDSANKSHSDDSATASNNTDSNTVKSDPELLNDSGVADEVAASETAVNDTVSGTVDSTADDKSVSQQNNKAS